MADDVNPTLRAELVAAKDQLSPEIRGLKAINNDSLPDGVHSGINQGISVRRNRIDLIQAVLNGLDGVNAAMDALLADNYPAAVPSIELPPSLLQAVRENLSDVGTAGALFVQGSGAVTASIEFGAPVDKP